MCRLNTCWQVCYTHRQLDLPVSSSPPTGLHILAGRQRWSNYAGTWPPHQHQSAACSERSQYRANCLVYFCRHSDIIRRTTSVKEDQSFSDIMIMVTVSKGWPAGIWPGCTWAGHLPKAGMARSFCHEALSQILTSETIVSLTQPNCSVSRRYVQYLYRSIEIMSMTILGGICICLIASNLTYSWVVKLQLGYFRKRSEMSASSRI